MSVKNNKFTDFTTEYAVFDKSKKYTILIPDMLPWHFDILNHVLKLSGYDTVILKNHGREVIDEGLKHVHNDTCYPALCVIGQYISALKSGNYDLEHTAVLITQTGGGCRASNYVPLIRKALKTEFPSVPVVSLNFSGLEKSNGLDLTLSLLRKIAYGIFYGDSIMTVYNQVKPYEINSGDANLARKECIEFVCKSFENRDFKKLKKIHTYIFNRFKKVEIQKTDKIKVGIVGEIYVKYSPLGNNNLEEFLIKEGCEPVLPSLLDFVMYCCINNINDKTLYNNTNRSQLVMSIVYKWLKAKQKKIIKLFSKDKTFVPMHDITCVRKLADKVIHQGVKMGEGWLIPAEMSAFAESGVNNVVCAQPFGCLPNHIVGKGSARTVKKYYPDINIVPIDYDPSATKVNQENRIKLMIATAKTKL